MSRLGIICTRTSRHAHDVLLVASLQSKPLSLAYPTVLNHHGLAGRMGARIGYTIGTSGLHPIARHDRDRFLLGLVSSHHFFATSSHKYPRVMNGTADTITHCTITPSHGADYREGLFTAEHFASAWGTLRCKYPLLGARVERLSDKETCRFVVDDRSLGLVSEAELSVQVISSEAEAVRTVENALNGPRQLSDTVLARCSVLQRSDQPIFHLIFSVAHLITDGMANYTITRTFLNLLAASGPLPPPPDLYQRLQMVPSQESLMPVAHMNMARQRWRRAIAAVILNINQSKMVGGHTLPNMMNAETFETPAKSSQLVISLPPDVSKQVVASCRARGITFGHAYPLLAQLAMARLLYRRYIRGEISRDDWERRIREPTHTGGPLNLRPFLSKDWYHAGGEREVNLCISFFFATMPFMPAGPRGSISATLDQSGAPGFSNLLSHDRFFLRASGVRKQITQFMKHPFFLEMTLARGPSRIARVRDMALAWQARKDGQPVPYTARTSSGTIPSTGLVMQNGGSSFGVVSSACYLHR
jgi:hypothetical protein